MVKQHQLSQRYAHEPGDLTKFKRQLFYGFRKIKKYNKKLIKFHWVMKSKPMAFDLNFKELNVVYFLSGDCFSLV